MCLDSKFFPVPLEAREYDKITLFIFELDKKGTGLVASVS
jgi:hypothetical protein